jgi:outer membrane lipoprotein SlyB
MNPFRRVILGTMAGWVSFGVICLGTAPADLYIYPAKGQSGNQQDKDEYDCHQWATAQTGVDPVKLAHQEMSADQPVSPERGGAVRGAAGGAALGAIGGAIGGDAGKGAAAGAAIGGLLGHRRARMEAQQQQNANESANQARQ